MILDKDMFLTTRVRAANVYDSAEALAVFDPLLK